MDPTTFLWFGWTIFHLLLITMTIKLVPVPIIKALKADLSFFLNVLIFALMNLVASVISHYSHFPKRVYGAVSYGIGFSLPVITSHPPTCNLRSQQANKLSRFPIKLWISDRQCHGQFAGHAANADGVWMQHACYGLTLLMLALFALLATTLIILYLVQSTLRIARSAVNIFTNYYHIIPTLRDDLKRATNALDDVGSQLALKTAIITESTRHIEEQERKITILEEVDHDYQTLHEELKISDLRLRSAISDLEHEKLLKKSLQSHSQNIGQYEKQKAEAQADKIIQSLRRKIDEQAQELANGVITLKNTVETKGNELKLMHAKELKEHEDSLNKKHEDILNKQECSLNDKYKREVLSQEKTLQVAHRSALELQRENLLLQYKTDLEAKEDRLNREHAVALLEKEHELEITHKKELKILQDSLDAKQCQYLKSQERNTLAEDEKAQALQKQMIAMERVHQSDMEKQKRELDNIHLSDLEKQKIALENVHQSDLEKQKRELESVRHSDMEKQKRELDYVHQSNLKKQKAKLLAEYQTALAEVMQQNKSTAETTYKENPEAQKKAINDAVSDALDKQKARHKAEAQKAIGDALARQLSTHQTEAHTLVDQLNQTSTQLSELESYLAEKNTLLAEKENKLLQANLKLRLAQTAHVQAFERIEKKPFPRGAESVEFFIPHLTSSYLEVMKNHKSLLKLYKQGEKNYNLLHQDFLTKVMKINELEASVSQLNTIIRTERQGAAVTNNTATATADGPVEGNDTTAETAQVSEFTMEDISRLPDLSKPRPRPQQPPQTFRQLPTQQRQARGQPNMTALIELKKRVDARETNMTSKQINFEPWQADIYSDMSDELRLIHELPALQAHFNRLGRILKK